MTYCKEDFKALKKSFKKNKWRGLYNYERLLSNINVKKKGRLFLYNYGNMVLVKRNHPVIVRCRGIIIRDDGKIMNYPFDRFFNEFEPQHAWIDFNTAIVQEKVDGSLICLWFNGLEWEVSTRGSFCPAETGVDFSKLFFRIFKGNHELLNKDYCYMFELITKENRIVTWYDEEFIVLLGARNLKTFKEEETKTLDKIAKSIKVRRPKTYLAKDITGCKRLFSKLRDDEEGLVVVDANFNRVKLKQSSYIKLSRIKMLKEQDIFNYILGKEEIDQEYLNKCPEVIEKINELSIAWSNIINEVNTVYEKIKGLPTRKEFALEAIKYSFKGLLFAKLDGKKINELNLKVELLNKGDKE